MKVKYLIVKATILETARTIIGANTNGNVTAVI